MLSRGARGAVVWLQFDLVCSRAVLVEHSMMLNNVGQALGALVFAAISDSCGRKPVFLVCLWSSAAIAVVQALSVNMAMYTILGFFDGVIQQVGS